MLTPNFVKVFTNGIKAIIGSSADQVPGVVYQVLTDGQQISVKLSSSGITNLNSLDVLYSMIVDVFVKLSSGSEIKNVYLPPVFKNGWLVFDVNVIEDQLDTELFSRLVVANIVKQHYNGTTKETIDMVVAHYVNNILPTSTTPKGDIIKYRYSLYISPGMSDTYLLEFDKCVVLTNVTWSPIRSLVMNEIEHEALSELSDTIIRECLLFGNKINPRNLGQTSAILPIATKRVFDTIEYLYPEVDETIKETYVDLARNTVIVLYESGSYFDVLVDVTDTTVNELSSKLLQTILSNSEVRP